MDELGYPNFDHRGFVGLAAPAKTPASVVAYLNKQLNEVVQSEAFRKRMEALGMTVPASNTPDILSRPCNAKPHAREPWPSSPATSRSHRSAECAPQ